MSRISQLINEVKSIGSQPSHRNALQIHKILEGNEQLFSANIDPASFKPILKNFESLAESSAREFNSSYFSQDYSRNYELLMFYLNKVI